MTTGYDSIKVELATGQDPIATTPLVWTDYSSSWRHITTNRGRDEQWQAHPPGTATVTFSQQKSANLRINGLLSPNTPIRISANDSTSTSRKIFTGFLNPNAPPSFDYQGTNGETTVQFVDALGYLSTVQLTEIDTPAYGWRKSGAMITALDTAFSLFPAWQTEDIDTGQCLMQHTSLGTDAMQLIQNIVMSEGGAFYADRDGNLVFDERTAIVSNSRLDSVQQIFDGSGATGPSFGFNWSVATAPYYTEASVQMANSDVVLSYESVLFPAFGKVSYPKISGAMMGSSAQAMALADRLVMSSNMPLPVPKITLFPRKSTTALDAALKRELRDLCTFATTTTGPTPLNLHVERLAHTIDAPTKTWTVDMAFSSRDQLLFNTANTVLDPRWFQLDDATKGKLDGTRQYAW